MFSFQEMFVKTFTYSGTILNWIIIVEGFLQDNGYVYIYIYAQKLSEVTMPLKDMKEEEHAQDQTVQDVKADKKTTARHVKKKN